MESNLEHCPKLVLPVESSDAKYISGLSTILVATIEEAKDRISQIEYIFCSQLFPKFQLNSQGFQKVYSEAWKAAEDAFGEKEKELLFQIKKLQNEKEQILEENQLLKLEKAKFLNMENQLGNHLKELQKELTQKSMEVMEGKEVQVRLQKLLESKSSIVHSYENTIEELEQKNIMHLKKQANQELDVVTERENKLLQMNQSKESLIGQKDEKLKEYEEKVSALTSKLETVEKNVGELLSAVKERTAEVEKGKELQGNLLKKIDYQASEIMNNEQMLNNYEEGNKQLRAKIEKLLVQIDELQKEPGKKNNELEEEGKVQEKLLQRINSLSAEYIKRGKVLEQLEKENKLLQDRQKELEEKADQLRQKLYEERKESGMGMELHQQLLQKIKDRDAELESVKWKRDHLIKSYKNLKSQYNYLLEKVENPESNLYHNRKEDECETTSGHNSPLTSDGEVAKSKGKDEVPEDNKQAVVSPSNSNILITKKCPTSVKSCPPAGTKRPSSSWRDTRSYPSRLGPDLHDDFLDTPLENVREIKGKIMKQDVGDIPSPGLNNKDLDSSDAETEDMDVDPLVDKPQMAPPRGHSGFKYVEPVRKKSDRESLKGVECKQCKKFYDAVLPETDKKSDGTTRNMRCEHHDGVSRHRYRYQPPSTPEGFWNIGFESEISITSIFS